MSAAIRQDAWSDDDDLMLAEVTLRHIREGSTQLNAFEEVGERIGRTAAACGFRWNSFVRKKYEAAIQIAKSQRQKRSQQRKKFSSDPEEALISGVNAETPPKADEPVSDDSISMEAVIRFLRQWKGNYQEMARRLKALEKELGEKTTKLQEISAQNDRLNKEVSTVQTDYRVVNDDYKALIQIMDRARKLAFLENEDEENRSRFKMEPNGNLERIE